MPLAIHNLHVPLPARLYRAFRSAALRQGRPATQIAREAILLWLEHERRAQKEDALAEYIRQMAGSEDDLDLALEAVATEHLVAAKPRRKK